MLEMGTNTSRTLKLHIFEYNIWVTFLNPPLDVQIAVQNTLIKHIEEPSRKLHVWWDKETKIVKKIEIKSLYAE